MNRIQRHARPAATLIVALLLLGALTGAGQAAFAGQPAAAQTAAAGQRLAASTFIGGSGGDTGGAVELDAQGNIYVAADSYLPSVLGRSLNSQGSSDIVVAKLSPDASRLLGLFAVGSPSADRVGGMAVTPQGEVVLTVETEDPSFPTRNAVRAAPGEDNSGVVLKINAALDGLVFSTFTDLTIENQRQNVGLDGAGNISVIGYTYDPFIRARDLTLQRYSPDGRSLLSTTIWGDDLVSERAQALVVRPDGTTYIAGHTEGISSDLAVTDGALQPVCARKVALGDDWGCDDDAFVMRLSPDGAISYSTYLGGVGSERAVGLGVDSQGAMYLLGSTTAVDFPTTAGALQPSCPTAKPEDGCYYDAFVAKLAADGSRLEYSTYLGSRDLGGLDYPVAIAVDGAGNATVVGFTASESWPVQGALQPALSAFPCPNAFQDRLCFDSVVATFAPDGQLAFSSYLGGKGDELSGDVALGADGSIYLTGVTASLDYPATAGAAQPALYAGDDAFLARIGPAGGGAPTPGGGERLYIPLVLR